MRLLSVHPAIVVYAQYPYEMHAAGYWWQVCRVLTAPSGGIDIGHPDYFWFYLDRVGPPPFSIPDMLSEPGLAHWFSAQHVGRVLAHTSSMIEAFYRHIAASQQKQAVSHFAEKQAIPIYSWLVWELYPGAREIFLVRDFRDLYCSILAFNRKRGVIAFERDNFDSDEAYARWLSECAVVLQRNWEARADRALLVRYEDLITAPQPEITRVLNYLGLDSRPGIVSMMLAQANMPDVNLQKHRTVDDAMQSIGRWRRELSPALQAVVNDAFRDSLRAFGYDV